MSKTKTKSEIKDYCTRIYGGLTDGSYEMCLHTNGYFNKGDNNEKNENTSRDIERENK